MTLPVHATVQFYSDKAAFQAASPPGLVTEDFEAAHLLPEGYNVCSDPIGTNTDDDCWNPGDILLGFSLGSSSASGTYVVGPGYVDPNFGFSVPSIFAGGGRLEDAVKLGFPGGTPAVGMDMLDGFDEDFTISVFGANNVLLGSTVVPVAAAGSFFGVTSSQTIKRVELTGTNGPLVDNVSFAPPPAGAQADMAVTLTGLEGPPGTMTYTLTLTNLGPDAASGVAAYVGIPGELAYVSDNCGGSNASPPWSRSIATLAVGASVVCDIVTTLISPQFTIQAYVESNGSLDLNPSNDSAGATGPIADLTVSLAAVENPPGHVMLTVTVTNNGPTQGSAIVASVIELPSALAYVSDDCNGSNTLSPWTWNIATLENGNNVVCHIQTTVVTAQGLGVQATVASNGPVDPGGSNNTAAFWGAVTGAGPNTPDSGVALFRSFYDLSSKDETGASFSLRAHADKVMLLQVCAVWCGPCNFWTSLSPQLEAAVEAKIGTGHFLDVDLLTQGPTSGVPSTQANALNWKNKYSFPGPVLHAEGGNSSALQQLDADLFGQYASVNSNSFFPEFFILAPDCNNQVAVRIAPGDPILGEQLGVDTSTVDAMANLIAQVWNDRPCVKPVVHRLDRCNVGSTPIFSNPQTGDFQEASEPFDVPSGKNYVISSVTAMTDAEVLDFAVYADAGGLPGGALCTSTGRPASAVYAPGVKKISLANACKLPSGSYWMSLKGHATNDASFVPAWQGGFLPPAPGGSYFYRDSSGCTAWDAAGQCLPGQQNAQLCYVLETDVLFSASFEAPVP